METLRKQAAKLLGEQKKYRRWLAVFLCLAVLVTSGTVASLMMSGQALNRKQKVLECHLKVHEHTAECYQTNAASGEAELVCGYADYVVHTHTEECRDGEDNLVCSLDEVENHVHEDSCYQEQRVLVCDLAEAEGHVHTEECRSLTCGVEDAHVHTEECRGLVCGTEESQGHIHTEECKNLVQGELTCTNTEEGHEHSEGCYVQTESITCGQEEGAGSHTHTESCYDPYACGLEEHIHAESCYAYTCGMTEGEGGHSHTLACYEVQKVAVCGKLELHTHVAEGENSCYDAEGKLICGLTELREHVHGEDCFRIIEEEDEAEESDSAEASEESDTDEMTASGESGDAETAEESGTEVSDETEDDGSIDETKDFSVSDGDAEEANGEEQADRYTLTAEGEDYTVTVSYGPEAMIPEEAELKVEEIPAGSEAYDRAYQEMLEALAEEANRADSGETAGEEEENGAEDEVEIVFARLFDISFMVDGEKIEPKAPVDIRISYQDSIECGEDETASAVHFAEDGTEVLNAEVTAADEGSSFEFTQNSFSGVFSVISKAPSKKQPKTLSTSVGDVEITVSYGESGGYFDRNDSLKVAEIKDESGNAESSNNRYRKYLNNSNGAIKEKTHQQGKEIEVYSARVFEISVVDQNGQMKSTDDVEVQIQYRNAVTAEATGRSFMVLNTENNAEVLGMEAFSAGQQITTFSGIQTFSADAPNVVAAMVTDAVPQDDGGNTGSGSETGVVIHHDPVEGFLKTADLNDWQIVAEGYKGNSKDDKYPTNDKVHLQKNVIPTNIENEFYVYLSIDMKEVYKKYFEAATYVATTSKGYDQSQVGKTVSFKGKEIEVSTENPGAWSSGIFIVKDQAGNILTDSVRLYWSQAENVSVLMKLSNGDWILCGTDIKDEGPHELKLSNAILEDLEKELSQKVTLGTVEDIMGEHIEFLGIKAGDYKVGEGYTGYNEITKTLTWVPVPKESVSDKDVEGTDNDKITWVRNAAELVYKVRLKVEDENFISCADKMNSGTEDLQSHLVNNSAKLTYDGEEAEFPKPYVRGLLYDLAFKKVDKDDTNKGLKGAEFTLTDANGKTYNATSDHEGTVRFDDLPWGTYTLAEVEAPEGYQPAENQIVKEGIKLCYTETHDKSPNDLRQDENRPSNMIYNKPVGVVEEGKTEADNYITNEKIPLKLVKEWADTAEEYKLDEVTFKVSYTYTDENGKEQQNEVNKTLKKQDNWILEVNDIPATSVIRVNEILEGDTASKYEVVKIDGKTYYGDAAFTTEQEENKVTYVYTVTNRIQKRQVQILKTAETPDAAGNPVYLNEAVFEVYDKDWSLEVNKGIQPIAGLGPWTSKTNDKGQDGVIYEGELPVGIYWLKEITAPENYELANAAIKIEVTAAQEGTEEILNFTITNKLAGQQVKILKKAAEGDSVYLDGAEFEVYDKDPSLTGNSEVAPITTWTSTTVDGQKGVIFIGTLNVGTYWLVETKAPDGYNLAANAFVLTIQSTSVNMGSAIEPDQDGTYTIEISNSAGYELPETGSIGTKPYTIGGAILATATVFLMYGYSMRRKKSERRSKK